MERAAILGVMDNTSTVLVREGSTVRAWLNGPPSARLVILAHGAGMDHRMFDTQINPLLEAGYRTAALDLRGHGESQPVGRTPVHVDALAEDMLALADELGAERFAIVGHSLGGFAAQSLMLHHEDRVAALTVIGSSSITTSLSFRERALLRATVRMFAIIPFRWLASVASRATAVHNEVKTYAYTTIRSNGRTNFLRSWRAISTAIRPVSGYSVPQPLLLTHGSHDSTGNVKESMAKWHQRDPHAHFAVISDAGHNANQDNPEDFNRHFLSFLDAHFPAQP